MERVAKSLEVLANPPPPVELTDRIAELERQLANAVENWRGWHKYAEEQTANYAPERERLRRENGALKMQLKELSKQRWQVEAHLKQTNIDLARAIKDRNDVFSKQHAYESLWRRYESDIDKLKDTIQVLQKGDYGRLQTKCDQLRQRNKVLQGRVSYWKRKNK